MFRHVVRSDPVTIEAPVEVVWGVLTDVANYAEWNPFTPSVKTDLQLGSPVHMLVTMGAYRLPQTEIVCALEPPTLLAWRTVIGARFLLHALREQRLEVVNAGTTCRYVTTDEFNGLLVPLVALLFGGFVRRGFNSVALGLKSRAEAEARDQP